LLAFWADKSSHKTVLGTVWEDWGGLHAQHRDRRPARHRPARDALDGERQDKRQKATACDPRHRVPRLPPLPLPAWTEEEQMLTTKSRQTSDDFNHRMFVNLAAAVWVGALMWSGYYLFSVLATVS
jgi:hypothetical protein